MVSQTAIEPEPLFSLPRSSAWRRTLRAGERFRDSRVLDERILRARKRVLGEEHPDTLMAMGKPASTLGSLGEYEKARGLEVKVLEARALRHQGQARPPRFLDACLSRGLEKRWVALVEAGEGVDLG